MTPSTRLSNFLERHLAELVEQLANDNITSLLSNLARIGRRPEFGFGQNGTNREKAVALLELLRTEGETRLLMAFLCALLHAGHCKLYCQFMGIVNGIDSKKFEQFAKTYDAVPFFNDFSQLPHLEENDHISPQPMDFLHEKRREFVERHAPLLRMKPTEMQMPMAMLTKWTGLAEPMENKANEKAMNGQQADAVACEQLISLLLAESQPANAYECFCIALLVTRQFHLFSIFHELANREWIEICWRHFLDKNVDASATFADEDNDETIENLPELKGVLNDLQVETVDSAHGSFVETIAFYRERRENVYPNFTSPRGLALIINNYYFPINNDRAGSPADVVNMNNLLKQLGYQVTIRENLDAVGMVDAIAKFGTRPEHWRLDSAIVVMMSHGMKETILGVDEKEVNVHELVGLLIKEAPGLRGKPKIFILQACRGDQFDKGTSRHRRPDECDGILSAFFTKSKSKRARDHLHAGNILRESAPPPMPSSMPLSIVNEPTEADVLIAYPTTPHFVSFRNSCHGSWFVQTICEVFSRYAKEEDILSMLTRVKRAVAKREFGERKCKQMPETHTRLRKKFFFFPGVQQSTNGNGC